MLRRQLLHFGAFTLGGLPVSLVKAEGVALDKRGTLYIVGEPNQLFVFEPKGK